MNYYSTHVKNVQVLGRKLRTGGARNCCRRVEPAFTAGQEQGHANRQLGTSRMRARLESVMESTCW